MLGRSAAPTTAAATSGGGHGHSSGPLPSLRPAYASTATATPSSSTSSLAYPKAPVSSPATVTRSGSHSARRRPRPATMKSRALATRRPHIAGVSCGPDRRRRGVCCRRNAWRLGRRGAIRGDRRGAKARVGCQPRAAARDRLHAAGSGARRRPISPARLQAVTGALVARRDLWADLVVHDPDVRWYLPLHRSNSCDVWLLAWECGQDTDWHDHGGSSGSFAAAEGCLVEQYRAAGSAAARLWQAGGLRSGRGMYTTWRTAAAGRRPVSTPTHRRCWR